MEFELQIDQLPFTPDGSFLTPKLQQEARFIFEGMKRALGDAEAKDPAQAVRGRQKSIEWMVALFNFVEQPALGTALGAMAGRLRQLTTPRAWESWPKTFDYTDEIMANIGFDIMRRKEVNRLMDTLVVIMKVLEQQDIFNAKVDAIYKVG